MEIKKDDVFAFRYNEQYVAKNYDPYHCFDGTLIAKVNSDGAIYLEDTYWSSDNRWFTPDEVAKQGVLVFKCNLNDYEACSSDVVKYYDPSDYVELYIHHGYRNKFLLKKGAVRSVDAMVARIQEEVDDKTRQIQSLTFSLERLSDTMEKVKAGDTDVYI
jgi:hypothetical protein